MQLKKIEWTAGLIVLEKRLPLLPNKNFDPSLKGEQSEAKLCYFGTLELSNKLIIYYSM